jgi:hypothetical protein
VAAPRTGSFGLFRHHYVLADDRVTITVPWRRWLVFPVLAAAGVVLIVVAAPNLGNARSNALDLMFLAAFLLFPAVFLPISMLQQVRAPGRIVITHDGVQWGREQIPRAQVAKVAELDDDLSIRLTDGRDLDLSLYSGPFGGEWVQTRERELRAAIARVLRLPAEATAG